MRTTLVRLCNGGYRVLLRYKHLREILEAQGNGGNSLFLEMFIRISTGKYAQGGERELVAIRYDITVKVYNAYAHRWIVNGTADTKEERVIAIRWDRMYNH